jgi:hypothetical protein
MYGEKGKRGKGCVRKRRRECARKKCRSVKEKI